MSFHDGFSPSSPLPPPSSLLLLFDLLAPDSERDIRRHGGCAVSTPPVSGFLVTLDRSSDLLLQHRDRCHHPCLLSLVSRLSNLSCPSCLVPRVSMSLVSAVSVCTTTAVMPSLAVLRISTTIHFPETVVVTQHGSSSRRVRAPAVDNEDRRTPVGLAPKQEHSVARHKPGHTADPGPGRGLTEVSRLCRLLVRAVSVARDGCWLPLFYCLLPLPLVVLCPTHLCPARTPAHSCSSHTPALTRPHTALHGPHTASTRLVQTHSILLRPVFELVLRSQLLKVGSRFLGFSVSVSRYLSFSVSPAHTRNSYSSGTLHRNSQRRSNAAGRDPFNRSANMHRARPLPNLSWPQSSSHVTLIRLDIRPTHASVDINMAGIVPASSSILDCCLFFEF